MKSFTDNAGRTWQIVITIDAVKRVKGLLDVNLLEIEAGDPPLISRLGTDEVFLCDVIWCLIQPQAQSQNVTDEDFGRALGGDAILAAQTALFEELIDFFQKRGRIDRVKALGAQRAVIDLAIRRAETQIDTINLDGVIEKAFGNPSTSSPV